MSASPSNTVRLAGLAFWMTIALVLLFHAAAPYAWAYAIGHTSATYTDPARSNRSIPSEIYYPADIAGENVPVALPPEGGFPVVAFGHGFFMGWDSYAYIWQALAPAGYVVVLPRTEGSLFPSHEAFGLDLAFLIRRMRIEGATPGSRFYGAISERAAVAGHSMGGGASMLAAAAEPSADAVFNLAAAETNPSAIAAAGSILAPALLFSGSHDCVTPPAQHQQPMYAALACDCKTWVTITGASHCQFAESNFYCNLGEGGCQDPSLSRAEQHAFVTQLVLPWLDGILKFDPQGWTTFQDLLASMSGITHEQSCAATMVQERDEPSGPTRIPTAGILLSDPAPNPSREEVRLRFSIPAPGRARMNIHDVTGRCIRTLVCDAESAGWQQITWDGRDDRGTRTRSGVYWCRLWAHGEQAAVMILRAR